MLLKWIQAPGEAEAELAYLNRIQAVDLVLTSDSDVFLFGATHVMRRLVLSSLIIPISHAKVAVLEILKSAMMWRSILRNILLSSKIRSFRVQDSFS